MPLYEYRCRKCGEEIEVIQKFSDKPLRRCRSCKGSLEKLISKSAFTLKGGGWYQQGYSSSSKSASSKPASSKPASSKKSSGSDGGSASGGNGSSKTTG